MKFSNSGHFITLEGGEGSGKSSLLLKLADYLKSQNLQVITTREPGGTSIGEKIRKMLLKNDETILISSTTELLLFLAARAQHIEEVIKPALNAGQVVLCDRFNDSTIAYQSTRGLDEKYVQQLCTMVCGTTVPKLTLFLDVDPEIGLMRTHQLDKENATKGEFDRIEKEEMSFHKNVRKSFLKLAKREPLRIYRIDANQSQEKVLKEAILAIEELVLLPALKSIQ